MTVGPYSPRDAEVTLRMHEALRGCGMCRNIEFMRTRDGLSASVKFAQQAVTVYRRTLLEKKNGVRIKGRWMRRGMIEAYLCSKRYIKHQFIGQ